MKKNLPKTVRRLTFNRGEDKRKIKQHNKDDKVYSVHSTKQNAGSMISNNKLDPYSDDSMTAHDSPSIDYPFSSIDTRVGALAKRENRKSKSEDHPPRKQQAIITQRYVLQNLRKSALPFSRF